MKKTIIIMLCVSLLTLGVSYAEIYQLFYPSTLQTINITPTIIAGTNIACSDVSGASYDVCSGAGGGGSFNPDNFTIIRVGAEDRVNGSWVKDYVDNGSVGGGNSSWNESYAWTIFAPITRAYWTTENYTSSDISNWNTAYGWGDHSIAGYSTAGNCSVDGSCSAITYDSELSYTVDTNCTTEGSCPLITYDSELSYIQNCSVDNSCSAITYDSELDYTTDTNETTRIDNAAGFSCTGSDKVSSFLSDLTPVCTADASGGGGGVGIWTSYYGTVEINTTVTGGIDDVNITGDLFVKGTVGNRTHRYSWAELNTTGTSDLSTYWSTSNFTLTNLTQYHTAYMWGNHGAAGYSTIDDNRSWNESYADTQYADISVVDTTIGNCSVTDSCDNVVYNDDLGIYWQTGNFSATNLSQYHTAWTWGDHSLGGYLTSETWTTDRPNYVNTTLLGNASIIRSSNTTWVTDAEIDADHDECSEITGCIEGAVTATNIAYYNQSNTFAENQTFSKNITVSDCIVFSNGGKIGPNC